MIRITQIKIPCGESPETLESRIRKALRTGNRPFSYTVTRHSVDARKKPQLFDVYTVDVDTGMRAGEEASLVKRLRNKNITAVARSPFSFPESGSDELCHRPVVIGAGPAGLFCALFLAEHGYRPLLIERGRRMEERVADVEKNWACGLLDPSSNVQFGEGGAGTFSDGKLNTQINDRTGRSELILKIFVEAGAPENILYEAKPHIGTDRLRTVIPNIRRRIERAGGEVRFDTVCTGLCFSEEESGRALTGVLLQKTGGSGEKTDFVPAQAAVLAIGHSARDTVEELLREGIPMEQKMFAVGFRVAHPQALIDESQYGLSGEKELADLNLSAAPYKLTARASSGRGVYSFCMCPGGYIVNASSEDGRLCVNGMSDEKRDSGWANSAIVITVGEKEFGSKDVLAGMRFQRSLEERAFLLGRGAVPFQKYVEMKKDCRRQESGHGSDGQTVGSGVLTDPVCPGQGGSQAVTARDGREGSQDVTIHDGGENSHDVTARDGRGGSQDVTARDSREMEADDFVQAHMPWAKGACRPVSLTKLLPPDLTADFIDGMEQFGSRIRGFNGSEAIVAGVESRTSSPVRITRGQNLESVGLAGLYPCGEGAGYAGGIMSAAIDGIRIAGAIAGRYAPLEDKKEEEQNG